MLGEMALHRWGGPVGDAANALGRAGENSKEGLEEINDCK